MIRVKINLVSFLTTNSATSYTFYGVDIESIENTNKIFDRITISYNSIAQRHRVTLEYQGASFNYDNNDILSNISDSYIIFSGNILRSTISEFNNQFITKNYIALNQDENITLCCYRQDDENNRIYKSLSQIVDFIDGHFNSAIGLKNLDIDLVGFFARQFNYVYIQLFNRYYFVDSIEFVSNDFTRLHLKEDVLMSHRDAILSQNAFVTRNQNAVTPYLVDNRLPLKDTLSVEYMVLDNTDSIHTKVNITINTDVPDTGYKYISVGHTNAHQSVKTSVPTPDSGYLPSFTSLLSKYSLTYMLKQSDFDLLQHAIIQDDNTLTYIDCVIWLPFEVSSAYQSASGQNNRMTLYYAGYQFLCTDGLFHSSTPTGETAVNILETPAGGSPYFIMYDFNMPTALDWKDKKPYANYEIYVMFVGWVEIDINQVSGDRCLIYYTLDYQSGMGTAYLYDLTKHKLIWSTNCQFGVKMDLTSTNALEISKQKQSNQLNMIMGLISSAISIGVGAYTGNGVAIAGGVMSAGKTIASNVNSNRMLFDKAQTQFGTSEGIIHSPVYSIIRKTYHEVLPNTETDVYESLQGYPYNAYVNLSDLEGDGYIEVGEIHFNPSSYDIYQDEVSEIVSLLKEGVII